jgi:acyl-CoA thioesterase
MTGAGARGEDQPDADEQPEAATVVAALYERDRAAREHGVRVLQARRGYVKLTMTVREDMLNGYGIAHGGMTFFLADTALAYASNAGNQIALAAAASIVFTAPARLGDVLTAECREIQRQGRSGVYDVTVTTSDGATVGLFRGQTVSRAETVLPEAAPPQPPKEVRS